MSKFYNNVPKTDKTIVLDLDNTLICSFDEKNMHDNDYYYNIDDFNLFHTDSYDHSYCMFSNGYILWGVKRPNLIIFLDFIFKYFENIIVWSAGEKTYVDQICKYIFQDNGFPCPKIIWARDKCEKQGKYYHKPLRKLIEYTNSVNSPVKLDINKMIILDDRTYTFFDNVNNGILIPAYSPKIEIDSIFNNDNSLLQFCNWCLTPNVINATSLIEISKTNIFI